MALGVYNVILFRMGCLPMGPGVYTPLVDTPPADAFLGRHLPPKADTSLGRHPPGQTLPLGRHPLGTYPPRS